MLKVYVQNGKIIVKNNEVSDEREPYDPKKAGQPTYVDPEEKQKRIKREWRNKPMYW